MEISGSHETPKKHYVDDLSFTFTENKELHVCKVHVSVKVMLMIIMTVADTDAVFVRT